MVFWPMPLIEKWPLCSVGLLCRNLILMAISQSLFHSSKAYQRYEEAFRYDARFGSLPKVVRAMGEYRHSLVDASINADNPISRVRYLDNGVSNAR